MEVVSLIKKLTTERWLAKDEWKYLISLEDEEGCKLLYRSADGVRREHYGNDVYVRGLIEFTNYCRNDCYYCGIRKSNKNAVRYRLSKEEILECCKEGYQLGFRTFVLQGGEDGHYTVEDIGEIVSDIRKNYPECAITLSFGEWEKEAYVYWRQCGADRYLLRHETANEVHYSMLHPERMKLSHRKQCLYDLKEAGYQVGAGFMVGAPGQTLDTLIEDMEFLKELNPQMVGIGPFLPHKDTPFAGENKGSLRMTLNLLALLRLMIPKVLLPATTSLGTLQEGGRELGMMAGANVVMPNLSPMEVRKKYMLYDNKIATGEESAQSLSKLKKSMEAVGYRVVTERGDSKNEKQ